MTDTATLPTRVDHPRVVFRNFLIARKPELVNMLPSDVSPDAFIRAAETSAQLNPEILACDKKTLWDSLCRACRDGLLPDGRDAAIVPFKSKASYMAMIDGLLRRARRSGKIKWIGADVVREGEEFFYFVDERGPHFKHVPGNNFLAPIISAYAAATTTDDGFVVTVLPRDELEKIRKKSRATREDAPWKEWPEQMMKKTAVRRLSRYLPDGRDWLPDEDDQEHEPWGLDEPAPSSSSSARSIGAGAALDAFAGSSTDDRPVEGTEVGAQEANDLGDSPSHDEPRTDEPAAGDRPSAADSLIAAYKLGQAAKAAGEQRKVPAEYYGIPDATKLAHAWLKGWDGQRL